MGGAEGGGGARCEGEDAAPVEAGGFLGLPQTAVGGVPETITLNLARTQKQVARGLVSHRDSSSFLGTVTPPPDPPHQPWRWPPISSPALRGWVPGSPLPTCVPRPPAGGHSHGPPAAGGADSRQGDPREESACPVSPHPKAWLGLLRPSAPRPASPRG